MKNEVSKNLLAYFQGKENPTEQELGFIKELETEASYFEIPGASICREDIMGDDEDPEDISDEEMEEIAENLSDEIASSLDSAIQEIRDER